MAAITRARSPGHHGPQITLHVPLARRRGPEQDEDVKYDRAVGQNEQKQNESIRIGAFRFS